MSRSLLRRSSLLYAALVVLTISVLVVLIFENQLDLIAENSVLRSRIVGAELRSFLQEVGPEPLDLEALSEVQRSRLASLDIEELVVYAEDGRVLTAVGAQQSPGEGPGPPPDLLREIDRAITRRDFENRLFHHVVRYPSRRVELYIPYLSDDGRTVVAFAEVNIDEVDTYLTYLYRQAAFVGGLVLLLHLLFAVYLYRAALKPLGSVMQATGEIARGELEVRIPIVRQDEIGRLAGAFNEMSVAIAAMREEARHANPLTGLPGNVAILREMEKRLASENDFAVLYIDIDNFKAYNDAYGFSQGDEAILFTRDCLQDATGGASDVFLGHEGGDDFVALIDVEDWEDVVKKAAALFDSDRSRFYDESDAKRGYIQALDRHGRRQRFPLMSLSIAVVTTRHRDFSHPAELVHVAAEVKKVAKRQPGSSFAVDMRGAGSEVDDG